MTKDIKKLLWIGVAAVIIIVGGIIAYNATQPPKILTTADPKLLSNANSHSTESGALSYPVTLVEFGDYQCPACGYAEPIVEKVLADNPKVKLIFRNFPLAQHQNALVAAEAAEAAGAQGKFWEMHNAIYANQDIWSNMAAPMDAFVEMAKKLNLDVEKFQQDVQNKKFADVIAKDRSDGIALGVNSTPSFFINGKVYSGGLSYFAMQTALNQAAQETETQQTSQQ